MKLIITDDLRYCPQEIPSGYYLVFVAQNEIAKYADNKDVVAAICTRGFAGLLPKYEFLNLRLIQLFSVGYDNLDLDFFKQKEVAVCNASGIYDDALAEYVLFAMLSVAKRFHHNLSNRIFRLFRNYHYISEISGKTIGIMGCGSIGSCIAHHLIGFNVDVVGFAKHTISKEGFTRIYHNDEILEFASKCDFVINTLPDNEETRDLINDNFLSHCKENVCIINIGRDSIFKDNDFYKFLKLHKNSTAILDQFELIPNPITNKFHRLPNVMITPRVAAISKESDAELKKLIQKNLFAFARNEQLTHRLI